MNVDIHEANANFSRLIQRVVAGEEITIARAGKPVAKLVPIQTPKRRTPGALAGRIVMSLDFDEPSPELERYFE